MDSSYRVYMLELICAYGHRVVEGSFQLSVPLIMNWPFLLFAQLNATINALVRLNNGATLITISTYKTRSPICETKQMQRNARWERRRLNVFLTIGSDLTFSNASPMFLYNRTVTISNIRYLVSWVTIPGN